MKADAWFEPDGKRSLSSLSASAAKAYDLSMFLLIAVRFTAPIGSKFRPLILKIYTDDVLSQE